MGAKRRALEKRALKTKKTGRRGETEKQAVEHPIDVAEEEAAAESVSCPLSLSVL